MPRTPAGPAHYTGSPDHAARPCRAGDAARSRRWPRGDAAVARGVLVVFPSASVLVSPTQSHPVRASLFGPGGGCGPPCLAERRFRSSSPDRRRSSCAGRRPQGARRSRLAAPYYRRRPVPARPRLVPCNCRLRAPASRAGLAARPGGIICRYYSYSNWNVIDAAKCGSSRDGSPYSHCNIQRRSRVILYGVFLIAAPAR